MADTKKSRIPGALSWVRKRVWLLVLATLTAIGAVCLELARDQARDLGGVLSWLAAPSALPTWVAALAVLVVVAFTSLGCAWAVEYLWPRKASTTLVQSQKPEPWSTFRGGIYRDRPWSWVGLEPSTGPGEVYPHCRIDGAQLMYDGSQSVGPDRRSYRCLDCGHSEAVFDQDKQSVRTFVLRDIQTGDWEARHREYREQIEKLAKASQAAPPLRARAASRKSPPATSA